MRLKINCHKDGCSASLKGDGNNVFDLVNKARAKGMDWIGFMDAGNGLEIAALCPGHSPPVKQAVALLVETFGSRSFSRMHFGFVARLLEEE